MSNGMVELSPLLEPITGDNPAGSDLREDQSWSNALHRSRISAKRPGALKNKWTSMAASRSKASRPGKSSVPSPCRFCGRTRRISRSRRACYRLPAVHNFLVRNRDKKLPR